jgi:predicted RNA methylase
MRLTTQVMNIIDASTLDGRSLRLPAGQLDRKTYLAVNAAIEAAGGKWDRKTKTHLFEVLAADAIDQIIASGGVTTKQELQQFWTPDKLADQMIEMASIGAGMKVLEPSAGRGVLALRARFAGAIVTVVEIGECARILEGAFGDRLFKVDFLGLTPDDIGIFDRVIMNPPFTRQADIHHVRHAMKFLNANGRLVAIMSGGTMFRENKLAIEFRAEIAALGGVISPLPEGSFKESGTMVNTCLLVVGAHR